MRIGNLVSFLNSLRGTPTALVGPKKLLLGIGAGTLPSGKMNPYQDYWRAASTMAQEFVKAVNAEGGHAKVLHLPDVGIKGNTHFPFSDKNSAEVAKVVEKWLSDNVK